MTIPDSLKWEVAAFQRRYITIEELADMNVRNFREHADKIKADYWDDKEALTWLLINLPPCILRMYVRERLEELKEKQDGTDTLQDQA